MTYIGDFAEDATLRFKFHTSDTLAGSPAFSVYKDSGTVESTAGITLTTDFDGVANLHQIVIDLSSDAFYAAGAEYDVVCTAGTVGGTDATGQIIRSFSIENRYSVGGSLAIAAHNSANVTRAASDETPILFTFPIGSLTNGGFTKTRRIDGGASASITGAVTYLYAIEGKHWYQLAYNAADRPVGEGVAQYVFSNGGEVTTINLHAVSSAASLDAGEIRSAVGLSAANLDAQLGAIDTVVDTILADTGELQSNQGNWTTADVSGLASSSALATVDANVDAILVDTGTTLPGTLSTIDSVVDSIKSVTDKLDTAVEVDGAAGWQFTTLALENGPVSSGSAPSAATVASAVRTELTTELGRIDADISSRLASAGYTAPDNTSIAAILADTNELQLNQPNWVTATGFSTHNAADVVTAMQAVADDFKADVSNLSADVNVVEVGGVAVTGVDDFKADVSSLATSAALATVDANVDSILADTSELQTNQGNWTTADVSGLATAASIAALNDFDPANDTVSRVTLVDTTTTNTDMRGTDGANTTAPDNASISAILADTNELQLNQSNWVTATGFSTHDAADVVTAMQAVADDFKADVSNLSADVNVIEVGGVAVTGVDDFKADVSSLATAASISALNDFDPANDTVSRVTLVDTTTTNTDMRGTDGANTVAPDNASIAAILADTGTDIPAAISGLNDISTADVLAQATSALNTYDPPTKAELDSGLAALNDFDPATDTVTVGTNNDKNGYALSTASITDIQAALIDEGDGQQLIDAILQVINANLDLPALELAAIAEAVRTELATELSRLDVAISTRLAAAGYTAPDNASIASILADTNELQSNQGDWATADVSALATSASIAALNDFDPANDTVARVTLVDTTTTNTDMRGTDNAPTAAEIDAELTANHGVGTWTTADLTDVSDQLDTIQSRTDIIGVETTLVNVRNFGAEVALFTGESHVEKVQTGGDYSNTAVYMVVRDSKRKANVLIVEDDEFVEKTSSGLYFNVGKATANADTLEYSIRLADGTDKLVEKGEITVLGAPQKRN